VGDKVLGAVLVGLGVAILVVLYEALPDQRGLLIFGAILAAARRS
jgi:hypothetical protein